MPAREGSDVICMRIPLERLSMVSPFGLSSPMNGLQLLSQILAYSAETCKDVSTLFVVEKDHV